MRCQPERRYNEAMKILVTGGHLTPALSFIDWTIENRPSVRFIFVGREFSQDVLQQKAVERYEVEKRGIPFLPFHAVRMGGQFLRALGANAQSFVRSIQDARSVLQKHRPSVVVSFGGYVAVPFVIAAWFLHIPVVTHEQTLTFGFANWFIGWFASAIAVSFSENTPRFLSKKTVVTGNPLRAGVFQTHHPRPDWLPSKLRKPLVIVMGGNQGSRALNTLVEQTLPELLTDWTIVHQCGQPTAQQNAAEVLERAKKRLSPEFQSSYFIKEWIDEKDLFWMYRHALCAISRSGANTVHELAAARLPAILIPLPSARQNEQYKNAQWLAKSGGAIVLNQQSITPQQLLESLKRLQAFGKDMRAGLATISLPTDASERLYALVETVASP